MKKPPLKSLHEHVREIQDAAHQVAMAASAIYGAAEAHCDMLNNVAPGAATGLRKVIDKYYLELQNACERLYGI
jgi:hypothetical protein